ncbi:tRNA (adenosine(37)-N6)-dimethylallyltransferase MiaA [Candidatus Nomurabacteria bacterium RIFCSPHIGHO2_02_FULL_41_18]|uniref:tRNA dimethylallyltransferase n=1 Tax=Candidatus Nomurabacteria bacterium RIFCSPHIGHO2_02_FULL_41_18 TaxID=1801754 RepID=A0A1F6W6N3_9BACT|nr:MAG: tRNA (adenosine(37)-N6)-dimethylallyltransferase MiaA [Candidatus Nomurabacteria bacterium RIFCSPHIGHO2_01_FULL_41_71]OGI77559.1 MAG: tRNA (adenosine(37)-N6)-dimethylallyltransferase MiaA [Candidatus Nomurabacteria bacterium RIFCSPHIGHO2_02_FULL_41_18]OGI89059.1 MAG: tRNA (adenosine(37)-N6)-dimethylallyltransferase MiaA [Candidatus Nomurabacteria bacterium RIFCSPLOWO2_01_FULL_41_52b]OGJ00440.1 MAG: tRNA (adenosine(37)-N6)-dimethylallyltransferase MiaA [Candidatus Nomurabacteria bacterium
MKKPKVIVILGQTATGKSDLAVKIAGKIGGEIISADSRQVYKGLDIGTGKITKKQMMGTPHHLLNVISPKNKFSVEKYQKLTISAMAEIVSRGKIPIICGGTGFYIDAVTKGLKFPSVPLDKKLRRKLAQKSATVLFRILIKLDKNRAKNIDPKNKVRLIRAIEIAKALGKVPHLVLGVLSYKFIKIGLYLPPEKLKEKVEKRVKKMFKTGLLKEIEKLKKSGVSENRLRELGFEYFHPTPEKVITETIKYAKRQMTWFKRDKDIKWFDASKKIYFKKTLYY